jgi:hypothetical protein
MPDPDCRKRFRWPEADDNVGSVTMRGEELAMLGQRTRSEAHRTTPVKSQKRVKMFWNIFLFSRMIDHPTPMKAR